MFFLFSAFILSCGTTHLMEIWTIWHADYWLSGLIKTMTAIVSLYTVSELVPLLPQALALPSPKQLADTNLALAKTIAERQEAQEALQQLNQELLQSNYDLEMFAYVASHDLQEPLRAINSYAQLLARKYQDRLDAKADKYIGYIVEGATRMQQLISDLLEFSRVGTQGKELIPTESEAVLERVLANLRVAIAKNRALITHDPLPTILGDEIQLIQLLQNLIANAIKFRREEQPKVHISVEQKEEEWLFSVRDNGIGMEPAYFDRIFTIFQCLHSRSEYSGTGIGLAVCKKIVERHGGRIWVESKLGVGTTFHFTLRSNR
jgi:light-regulated signal transduction histidine kinase (bacteriophytochrome)